MKLPFPGRILLHPELIICSDEGNAFAENHPEFVASKAFVAVADDWKKRLDKK